MKVLDNHEDYFGLDIGTSGVRVVQLKKGEGAKPELVTMGSAPLPSGLSVSDSPVDQDKTAQIVKDLVAKSGVTTDNVVLGLGSANTFASIITVPKLSEKELASSIKLQADQYIPMPVDQVKLDWQVVGESEDGDKMHVFLAAAPNTAINKLLALIEKAGLKLSALEINALAVTRSLVDDSELPILIVDVGDLSTDVTIVYNHVPQLVRSINIGGNTFVSVVSQSLGLEQDQAIQFIQKFGLTQTKLEGQVLKALKGTLETFTGELQKSIKYYLNQNKGSKLEKVLVSGSAAAMPEFNSFLANSLEVPVGYANPWVNVSFAPKWQQQANAEFLEFPVAVGLAQRSFL